MPEPTPAPLYIWMDVGHVNVLPDGTLVQRGNVAVDPDTGVVLDPQPDYPKDPEPEVEPPAAEAKSTKSAS